MVKTAIETSAETDLRKKRIFERDFLPTIQRVFRVERKLFRRLIVTMGLTPAPRLLSSIWRDPLHTHFDLVATDFANLSAISESQPLLRATIEMQNFIDTSSMKNASDISATSARDMQVSSALAGEMLRQEQQLVTNTSVAAVGTRILARKQHAREGTISVTETQTAAEGGKAIGAQAIGQETKTWVTVRDTRVRSAHINANGQRASISGVFVVAGQQLRYPGDRSLGASVGNVANCRCAAIYV